MNVILNPCLGAVNRVLNKLQEMPIVLLSTKILEVYIFYVRLGFHQIIQILSKQALSGSCYKTEPEVMPASI